MLVKCRVLSPYRSSTTDPPDHLVGEAHGEGAEYREGILGPGVDCGTLEQEQDAAHARGGGRLSFKKNKNKKGAQQSSC